MYVHQDTNWNVGSLTDLCGSVVERYIYTPYGQVTMHQETGYGDYGGDHDVDQLDRNTISCDSTPVSGACRILDLDCDGDVDATDRSQDVRADAWRWMRGVGSTGRCLAAS